MSLELIKRKDKEIRFLREQVKILKAENDKLKEKLNSAGDSK